MGERWTKEEDEFLLNARKSSVSVDEVVRLYRQRFPEVDRSPGAIFQRSYRMGQPSREIHMDLTKTVIRIMSLLEKLSPEDRAKAIQIVSLTKAK